MCVFAVGLVLIVLLFWNALILPLVMTNEKVNKQCLLDTPRTVRVSEKT